MYTRTCCNSMRCGSLTPLKATVKDSLLKMYGQHCYTVSMYSTVLQVQNNL